MTIRKIKPTVDIKNDPFCEFDGIGDDADEMMDEVVLPRPRPKRPTIQHPESSTPQPKEPTLLPESASTPVAPLEQPPTRQTIIPHGRYRKLNLSGLATDVVLFGQDDLEGVAAAHKLTPQELSDLIECEGPFRTRYLALRKAIEADPQKMLTLRASAVIEAHVTTMSQLIADDTIEARDRVKAFETIAKIAGVANTTPEKGRATGLVVSFNMGIASLPAPDARPVNVIIHNDD